MKPHHRTVLQTKTSNVTFPFAWDSEHIRALVDENTDSGSRPAFLIVGKREAEMLREHLGSAFGPAAVQCLKNTYYMGLQVVEDPAVSLLCVSGRKAYMDKLSKKRSSSINPSQSNSRWRFSA